MRSCSAGIAGATLLGALTAGGLLGCGGASSGPVFPGRHWARRSPAAAGYSAEKLAEFSRRAGGTGCVVQGGRMIHEWGNPSFRNDAASSTKVFYTWLVLQALQEGRLRSLDDPIAEWVPALTNLNPALGFKDRGITFRHLLRQTSGYGLAEPPGVAFAYNDHATGLLSWLLFHRVFGREPARYDEVLNESGLGAQIGFEDRPTAVHPNTPRGRLRISARDMARFGLLHLRGGQWRGRPVLAPELFRAVMDDVVPPGLPRTSGREAEILPGIASFGGGRNEKGHAGCLGCYWWHNRFTPDGARLLPDAPPGTFLASGYGGRFALIIVPEEDLVVVWMNVHPGEHWSPFDTVGRFKVNGLLREVLAARRGSPPQPPGAHPAAAGWNRSDAG